MACTSDSDIPLSSRDWIWVSSATYSVNAPSSMLEVSWFSCGRKDFFSASVETVLYCRSSCIRSPTCVFAVWISSCCQTGITTSAISWAYSMAAARRSLLYFAFRASSACWRSALFSISWIRAYSLSYCSSRELFTADMPSAAATMAFSYTVALTSCPRASARATSASTLFRMVSKPSVSAADR